MFVNVSGSGRYENINVNKLVAIWHCMEAGEDPSIKRKSYVYFFINVCIVRVIFLFCYVKNTHEDFFIIYSWGPMINPFDHKMCFQTTDNWGLPGSPQLNFSIYTGFYFYVYNLQLFLLRIINFWLLYCFTFNWVFSANIYLNVIFRKLFSVLMSDILSRNLLLCSCSMEKLLESFQRHLLHKLSV